MNEPVIVDIFDDIITNVRAKYDTILNKEPYYLFGHPLEIINVLSEKTKNDTLKFEKFPLVALFQDFDESKEVPGQVSSANLRLVICTDTKPEYSSVERYTNSFKTVLYPIYELLIDELRVNKFIKSHSFSYTKTDRLYWGKQGLYGNDGNIFNDFIDAIEITNLNLSFNYNNC